MENIELTDMILKELKCGEEMIEYVEDRLGHDRRYSIDFSKLRGELGWEPEYDFEKALKETVKWYKENEWWWEKLV
jgi:dTDP-glucose 4,6-dehydratase